MRTTALLLRKVAATPIRTLGKFAKVLANHDYNCGELLVLSEPSAIVVRRPHTLVAIVERVARVQVKVAGELRELSLL